MWLRGAGLPLRRRGCALAGGRPIPTRSAGSGGGSVSALLDGGEASQDRGHEEDVPLMAPRTELPQKSRAGSEGLGRTRVLLGVPSGPSRAGGGRRLGRRTPSRKGNRRARGEGGGFLGFLGFLLGFLLGFWERLCFAGLSAGLL